MIYEPAEDSFLILKHIRDYARNKKVLDIGTGSGILAREARKYTKNVTASDVNKICEMSDVKFIHSNLFENIKKKFDLIIFNPPYLPRDEREDEDSALATTGGKEGHELIENFLKKVGNHLNKDGKILLLFSSITNKEIIDSLIELNGFNFRLLESKKVPFEMLYCYLIHRR
jgi:release factor glutamine methyltransferase